MKIKKHLAGTGVMVLCLISLFEIALAQDFPCDGDIPACPSQSGSHGEGSYGWGGCNYPNSWHYDDDFDQPYLMYLCNGKSTTCGDPGDNCNIMVMYEIQGKRLTCQEAGITFVCASSVGPAHPMNLKCSGGGCAPGQPVDTLPDDLYPLLDGSGVNHMTQEPAVKTWPGDN